MIHSDISGIVEHWITVFRMDPDNRYFHLLLQKLAHISPEQLRAASVVRFLFSAAPYGGHRIMVRSAGGRKYLTVIATSSFVPLELYELSRKRQ